MTTSHIQIIDEQTDFIVVDKPTNINFHDEGDIGKGFFNEVKQFITANNNSQTDVLYPVHRLDKITSGLLIFAKNKTTAAKFQQLFEQHAIQKYYLAISDKKPKKKQGLIKGDMVKSRRSMWKLLRTQHNPAITQFVSYSLHNKLRLYLLKPHSGKTHQIRVALSSLGSPIIGDPLYTKNTENSLYDRGYLHAYALQFTLNNIQYNYLLPPSSGEHFLCEQTIKQLEEIKAPWTLSWPKL